MRLADSGEESQEREDEGREGGQQEDDVVANADYNEKSYENCSRSNYNNKNLHLIYFSSLSKTSKSPNV